MNLQISGHHIEVTPALREYVENKLDPVVRHFDKVTGVNVVLSVEKLKQKAEVTVHVPGKDMHVEESGDDLYAAIDALCSTSWIVRYRNTSKRFRITIAVTSLDFMPLNKR
jgi:putative sigma-54 modulation protein